MRWLLASVLCCASVAAEAREVAVLQFGVTGTSPETEAAPAGTGFVLNNLGARPVAPETGHSVALPIDADTAAVALTPAPAALSSSCLPRPMPAVPVAREAAMRRQHYWRHVADAECRHGLPAGLLDALVLQESRYLPDALSPAGAAGLAQLMPATARTLGVADRLDPLANVDGGARFLRAMLDRFGSVSLALAAYNAGPGRVEAARGIPAITETRHYVRNVLSFWSGLSDDPQRSLRATAQLLGFATTAASSQTAQ
jgi:hypothetical protein